MMVNMRFRAGPILCLATIAWAQAGMELNVTQLAEFIRSEIALNQHNDKQIAAYVKKIKLTKS